MRVNEPAEPAHARGTTAVACRCCPGGISRSTRMPCYPPDMSGAGWALTEPALPPPAWTPGRVGRPAEYGRRDITGGIRYLVKEKSGATGDMRAELRRQCGIAAGRAPEPTAAIIGSHLVKAAGTAGNPSRGYDAGKKISGRKRHIAVDTTGLLLTVLITAAGVQDRDGAEPLLWNLRTAFPPGQAHLGRRRIRRQAGHLGQERAQAEAGTRDRQAARRPAHLPGAAPPLGRRADPGIDHPLPPGHPRLRTPARTPRDHDSPGNDIAGPCSPAEPGTGSLCLKTCPPARGAPIAAGGRLARPTACSPSRCSC